MNKIYDLEERTLEFSKRVMRLCKALPKDNINRRLSDQVLRSSSSVGANYIEANEKLSKKDFKHRVKISRKECKETTYWFNLIVEANLELEEKMKPLINESVELRKILSTIIDKAENKKEI